MWFKVDDELHDHPKARKAGKAAMGVWALAGSWSADRGTNGFVPEGVLSRWGNRTDAGRLVAAGFWHTDEQDGERGWRFHDWSHFQPSAETVAAWRAAESEAGQRGNHTRWHVNRGVTDPNCPFCYRVPDQAPDEVPDRVDVGSPIGSTVGSASPVPIPDPITTSPNGEVGSPKPRDDVERLCTYLADAVEENGSKRPAVTKAWRDEARRLLDIDGRSEAEVTRAIDWCQRGESDRARFWRPNVMSMPKLRAKFDQMRLQAAQEVRPPANGGRVQQHMALVRQLGDDAPAPFTPREIGPA